jgi:hypothetical protein
MRHLLTIFIFFNLFVGIAAAAELVRVDFPNVCPLGTDPTICPQISGENILAKYILRLYQFALAIGGILAAGMIVVGAIYISVSGAIDKQAEGRDMIIQAIWGLVLLFSSYLILKTVNPQIVSLSPTTEVKKLTSSGCPPGQRPKIDANGNVETSTDGNIICEYLASNDDCGDFSKIPVWNGRDYLSAGVLEASSTSDGKANCAFRKAYVLSDFTITDDRKYYAEDEKIKAGEYVWLYAYFRKNTDPTSTAKCLVYYEKPDDSDKDGDPIDLNNDLQLCSPKGQSLEKKYSVCDVWTLTGEASPPPRITNSPHPDAGYDYQRFIFGIPISNDFNYSNPSNPPPTDDLQLFKRINVTKLGTAQTACFPGADLPWCRNLSWRCTAGR